MKKIKWSLDEEKELIEKYINIALKNWLFWWSWSIEKIDFWEVSFRDTIIVFKFYIDLKIVYEEYNLISLITAKHFIDKVALWIMPLWRYRDEWSCIRDLIDKTWLAIYKRDFKPFLKEILKIDN